MYSIDCYAQEDLKETKEERTLYVIKKTDGYEIYGYIIEDNGREILVETKSIGKIYINKTDLVEMSPVKSEKVESAEYSNVNVGGPYSTRYYFTTNALTVKKHENYAMLHLYGPEVHFSLSDKLSLGIMTTWIASPFAIAGKYSLYSKENTHLAVGSIIGSSGFIQNGKAFGGLHWLTATNGSRKTNLSISLGYGYINFGSALDIGEKYRFDKMYDQSAGYMAVDAVQEEVLGVNKEDINLYADQFQDAVVLGISGITPVGKSSSFIFDSMVFFRKGQKVNYSDYPVTVEYIDSTHAQGPDVTETHTIEYGEISSGDRSATILFMPSMRFQQSHNKAIQVSLGGFININSDGLTTTPFPMVSWLRQF